MCCSRRSESQYSCEPRTYIICISPSTFRHCLSLLGSTGSFSLHMLVLHTNFSSRYYEEPEQINKTLRSVNESSEQWNLGDLIMTQSLVWSWTLPELTEDLLRWFLDSSFKSWHQAQKKVIQECKNVRTWLTCTVYEKSGVCIGIFFSSLFFCLDFARGKPEPYDNHGCSKLNRMWPFASTRTSTGGKSTEPGDRDSTRGGGILPEKNANF